MSYTKYGISPEMVERVKSKMKNPVVKDKMKQLFENVTKADLQDRVKIRRLIKSATVILNEQVTSSQEEQWVQFVISQKIDPQNTFHLIKLWGMFR